MAHWTDKLLALRTIPKLIQASDYNEVRMGLLRIANPLRIELNELRCVDCLLDDYAWVCVDQCHNDLPLLAWVAFETHNRSALNEPVRCELRIYHRHAGLIMGPALEALDHAITDRLDVLRNT